MITRWYSYDRRRCTVQFRWSTGKEVLTAFTDELPDLNKKRLYVRSLAIAGAFTDWEPQRFVLNAEGVFIKSFSLVCGVRYEFRYLLNEKYWFSGGEGDGSITYSKDNINAYIDL